MPDPSCLYSLTLEHDPSRNPPCYYVPSEGPYLMTRGKFLEVTLGKSFPEVVEGYEDPSTWLTSENPHRVTKPQPQFSVLWGINIYSDSNGQPGERLGGAWRKVVPWDIRISFLLPEWWEDTVKDGDRPIYKLSLLSSDARSCRIWDEDAVGRAGSDHVYHFGLQVSMGGVLYGSDPEMRNTGGGRRRQIVPGLMGQIGRQASR